MLKDYYCPSDLRLFNNTQNPSRLINICTFDRNFLIAVIDTGKIGINGLDEKFLQKVQMYKVLIIGDKKMKLPRAFIVTNYKNKDPVYPDKYNTGAVIGSFLTTENANILPFKPLRNKKKKWASSIEYILEDMHCS